LAPANPQPRYFTAASPESAAGMIPRELFFRRHRLGALEKLLREAISPIAKYARPSPWQEPYSRLASLISKAICRLWEYDAARMIVSVSQVDLAQILHGDDFRRFDSFRDARSRSLAQIHCRKDRIGSTAVDGCKSSARESFLRVLDAYVHTQSLFAGLASLLQVAQREVALGELFNAEASNEAASGRYRTSAAAF